MADAISATNNVAPSYVVDNRSQAAPAQSQQADLKDKIHTARSVEAAGGVDKSLTGSNRASELTQPEQQKQMEAAVEKINEMMRDGQRSLSFSVDKEVNQVVITVKNTETDEVVRQIPNEDAIALSRHMESMMGLIFNDKA